jgi:hypothetical protein
MKTIFLHYKQVSMGERGESSCQKRGKSHVSHSVATKSCRTFFLKLNTTNKKERNMTTQQLRFCMKHFYRVAVRLRQRNSFFFKKKRKKHCFFRETGEQFEGECVSMFMFLQPA